MKTKSILAMLVAIFMVTSVLAQRLDNDFNVKPHNILTPKLTSLTDIDNENNLLQGIPDGDMDVYLYNDDYNVPIEFNIFIEDLVVNSAQLSLLCWDIDWAQGERDAVYFNSHFLGYLTGANAEWSTSVYSIDPSWVAAGPAGQNLIQIYVDVDNYYPTWAVQVDWGQLIIDNAVGSSFIRYVNTDKPSYLAGEVVIVSEEVDAEPSLYVRVETNIVNPSNQIIAGTSRFLTATTGDEPFTEDFLLPAGAVSGTYQVLTILYDGVTNIQQDIEYTPFVVGNQCLNPLLGGEIGVAQDYCGEFDPLPLNNITLPSGFIGNLEYLWQSSIDNASFFDIPNSNSESFDPDPITQTTWFKRLARVDCTPDWTGAAESNVIEMSVYEPIAVSISESLLPQFCQGLGVNLTAEVSLTPAESFLWSTGETAPTILAGASGVYSVTVTSAMGCSATASYDLTVDVTNLLSSYIMFSNKHIRLDGNIVNDGGVGVKNIWGGCVDARFGTLITDEGSFAKAKSVVTDATSVITNKYFAPLTLAWPPFEAMSGTGTIIVNIPDYATMTIDGELYKEVNVGKYATAIFTQPVTEVEKIFMNDGATLKFNQCTTLHLKLGLISKKNITINPDELNVVFYIDSDVLFMEGAHVAGVFYMGNSQSNVYKHKLTVNASKTTNPGIFKGMFLAESIYSLKNNHWYMLPGCNNCQPLVVKTQPAVIPVTVGESGIMLKSYPNPFDQKTTLFFTLPDDNHVKLDVFDVTGKMIRTLFNGSVSGGTTYTSEFDGTGLPAGMYIYRIATNSEVFTGKILLQR